MRCPPGATALHRPNFVRPTNVDSPSARGFWTGLSEKKLLGRSCNGCGAKFFPLRPLCPQCLTDDLEWVQLSEHGTLHSWTEVHMASPNSIRPSLLGLVDLQDGIGRIAAKIRDAEARQLSIGMSVCSGYSNPDGNLALYRIVLD